jgi:hypothetical protein
LVPMQDRSLNVNGDYVEMWCVSHATHVPCVHQSHKVYSVLSVHYFFFVKLLCIVGTSNYWFVFWEMIGHFIVSLTLLVRWDVWNGEIDPTISHNIVS